MYPARTRHRARTAGRVLIAMIPAAMLAACDYPYGGYAYAPPPPLPYPGGAVYPAPPPMSASPYPATYPPPGYAVPASPPAYPSPAEPPDQGSYGRPTYGYPTPGQPYYPPGSQEQDPGGNPLPIAPPLSGPPVVN